MGINMWNAKPGRQFFGNYWGEMLFSAGLISVFMSFYFKFQEMKFNVLDPDAIVYRQLAGTMKHAYDTGARESFWVWIVKLSLIVFGDRDISLRILGTILFGATIYFIARLLDKILQVQVENLGYEKEIIVVDDGSKDKTYDIASTYKWVKVLKQTNQGKGRAVQNGIQASTGDYILVQDADLEYDPEDYIPMLKLLNKFPNASIYGSRTLGRMREIGARSLLYSRGERQSLGPWIAGILLTFWTYILFGTWITDTLTAYKIYPANIFKSFNVITNGFETDHEITAKLIKSGTSIYECPIKYFPRTQEEGKKIGPKDGVIAVWTLLKFRFVKTNPDKSPTKDFYGYS